MHALTGMDFCFGTAGWGLFIILFSANQTLMKTLFNAMLFCILIAPAIEANAQGNGASPGKMLRHVVLFSFKADTPAESLAEIVAAFEALPSKIPQIRGFEWGLNNSPEGLNKGFTHCFTLTFASEEDRAVYLPHPDHKAFGDVLRPHLADVLVVDYWTSQ